MTEEEKHIVFMDIVNDTIHFLEKRLINAIKIADFDAADWGNASMSIAARLLRETMQDVPKVKHKLVWKALKMFVFSSEEELTKIANQPGSPIRKD